MATQRNRLAYAATLVVVIAAGLASRSRWAGYLPAWAATYAGDTLWALSIFLALAIVFPKAGTAALAGAATLTAFSIEVSELYQADWINRIRHTTLGGLVLGYGFKWSDLVCYTTGIAMGVAAESLARLRHTTLPDAAMGRDNRCR